MVRTAILASPFDRSTPEIELIRSTCRPGCSLGHVTGQWAQDMGRRGHTGNPHAPDRGLPHGADIERRCADGGFHGLRGVEDREALGRKPERTAAAHDQDDAEYLFRSGQPAAHG